jgi:hypothetical protein
MTSPTIDICHRRSIESVNEELIKAFFLRIASRKDPMASLNEEGDKIYGPQEIRVTL